MRRLLAILALVAVSLGLAWLIIPRSTDSLLEDALLGRGRDRVAAIKALDGRTDARIVGTFIKLVDDEDSTVAGQAAVCLACRGDPAIADLILRALDRDSVDTRWFPDAIQEDDRDCSFAKAAGTHPTTRLRLIERIMKADYGVEGETRRMLRALAFGGPAAIGPLLSVFVAKSTRIDAVAAQAAYSLIRLNATQAYPTVIERVRPWLLDWPNGRTAADLLRRMEWKPASEADRIHCYVATRDRAGLTANWELTKSILTEDLVRGSRGAIENALYALIGLGNPSTLDDLCGLLDAKGSVALAEAYINCGQGDLATAATNWARRNGYAIRTGRGNAPVGWGRLR